MSKRNTSKASKTSTKATRKAIAPAPDKGDTRPRTVAKEDAKRERELLASLRVAREKGDRQLGKKIRRNLRRIGHWGGLRLATPVK